MIIYNHDYIYSRGKGKILFSSGKNDSVTANYKVYNDEGTITGKFNGEVLEATFHSTSMNRVGLIHFTFTEDGFDAKWKNGLEPGAMRGRWFTENKKQNLNLENVSIQSKILTWKEIAEKSSVQDPMDIEDYDALKDDFYTYSDILNELLEEGTIRGEKIDFELSDLIQEAGRLFGKLAWLAAKQDDSYEYWCRKWASFNESVEMNCQPTSRDYLTLGQQYHLQYQPFHTEDDENNYPEAWFKLAYESANTAEELIDLVEYGLFSEYNEFEVLANQCVIKAWEMKPSINLAVHLISDESEEKRRFLDDEIFEKIVQDVNDSKNWEDGDWTIKRFQEYVENL